MQDNKIIAYYVFSPATRIFHWLMVVSMLVLFFTGLYIGNPSYVGTVGIEPTFAVSNIFSMSTIRWMHFIAGYVLACSFLLRIYGFAVHKGDRLFPKIWKKKYWQGAMDTQKHYMFLQKHHRPYLRNSLARTGYLFVYILLFLETITGFAMYAMVDPNGWKAVMFGWVNHFFGSEYMVHIIHHYIAWILMIFAIIHVYMVFRADIFERGGETSSMVSGVKFYHEVPEDIEDIQ